jgi:hypothetical protein
MDTRTGQIYDSREEAVAAGVPDEHLVTGDRKALEGLSRLVKRRNAQARESKRDRQRKAKREMQATCGSSSSAVRLPARGRCPRGAPHRLRRRQGAAAQMDLAKAREVVGMLQGAIEAATSDQMLFQFLTQTVGLGEDKASRALLDFRELRQGSRGVVHPS